MQKHEKESQGIVHLNQFCMGDFSGLKPRCFRTGSNNIIFTGVDVTDSHESGVTRLAYCVRKNVTSSRRYAFTPPPPISSYDLLILCLNGSSSGFHQLLGNGPGMMHEGGLLKILVPLRGQTPKNMLFSGFLNFEGR